MYNRYLSSNNEYIIIYWARFIGVIIGICAVMFLMHLFYSALWFIDLKNTDFSFFVIVIILTPIFIVVNLYGICWSFYNLTYWQKIFLDNGTLIIRSAGPFNATDQEIDVEKIECITIQKRSESTVVFEKSKFDIIFTMSGNGRERVKVRAANPKAIESFLKESLGNDVKFKH